MIKLIVTVAVTLTICVFYVKGITATFGSHWWTLPFCAGGGYWIGKSTAVAINEFAQ